VPWSVTLVLRFPVAPRFPQIAALHQDSEPLISVTWSTSSTQFRKQPNFWKLKKGMVGNDYTFNLTAGGRTGRRTARKNEVCQYEGPPHSRFESSNNQEVVKGNKAAQSVGTREARQGV